MEINRKKASQWYLSFLYMNFLLNLVKGVFIVPLYLKYMEPRLYGAWLACGGIIAYLGLCEFGVSRVFIQKVAVCSASSDNKQLTGIVSTGIQLSAALALLPFLIGLAVSPFVARIVQISGPESIELRNAFILASIAASLMIFSSTPRGVLQGMQRQVFVNICYTGGLLLGILVTLLLLVREYGLLAIPIGSLIHAVITASGSLVYMVVILRRQALLEWMRFDRGIFKEIFSSSSFEFGGSVAHTVSAQSDNLIIAAALSPELCNVFTFTGMAHKMSSTLGAYIPHATMAGLAHLAGESNPDRVKKVVADILKFSAMVGALLLCVVIFLNETLVGIWVGSQYYGGAWLNIIFFAGAVLSMFFLGLNTILSALGEFRTAGSLVILQGCVQLPLMAGLGYMAGIPGLALAPVLAMALAIPLQAITLIRRLNVSQGDLIDALYALGGVFAVPLAAVLVIRLFWVPSDVSQLILFCALYGSISVACYMTIYKSLRDLVAGFVLKRA
ncbi:MAG: hypothetical protein HY912_10680 [Desulfomonile tiedjei]|uniref:Membrane protein involved in the export of O-antigen and teichoic acid n=1 Tax=Desulfomonile tiedjei TaxID=2358 RepID=A0A9D6V1Y3_9BACT|nr:hypothetical protein [Desulfomonile tiedjei]